MKLLALSPGGTATEIFEVIGERMSPGTLQLVPEVVALALSALNKKKTPPSVVAGGMNRLNATLIQLFPRRALVTISGTVAGR